MKTVVVLLDRRRWQRVARVEDGSSANRVVATIYSPGKMHRRRVHQRTLLRRHVRSADGTIPLQSFVVFCSTLVHAPDQWVCDGKPTSRKEQQRKERTLCIIDKFSISVLNIYSQECVSGSLV